MLLRKTVSGKPLEKESIDVEKGVKEDAQPRTLGAMLVTVCTNKYVLGAAGLAAATLLLESFLGSHAPSQSDGNQQTYETDALAGSGTRSELQTSSPATLMAFTTLKHAIKTATATHVASTVLQTVGTTPGTTQSEQTPNVPASANDVDPHSNYLAEQQRIESQLAESHRQAVLTENAITFQAIETELKMAERTIQANGLRAQDRVKQGAPIQHGANNAPVKFGHILENPLEADTPHTLDANRAIELRQQQLETIRTLYEVQRDLIQNLPINDQREAVRKLRDSVFRQIDQILGRG